MKQLFFVTLASTALSVLCSPDSPLSQGPSVNTQDQQNKEPTYKGSATPVDCLATFNEARAAAGLASFVSAGNEFRIQNIATTNADFTNNVCKALLTKTPLEQKDTDFNRTIALAIQDGAQGDCAAAVTHFNGALSLFGDLPPAFSTETGSVYKKLQAVSFVALYNPKENPKLDCGYFTCTKLETTTTTVKPGAQGRAELKEEAESQTITATLHGLLCATSPPALIAGEAPFEQEQFDKIKGAINSASAVYPAFLTLAMAGAGFFLL